MRSDVYINELIDAIDDWQASSKNKESKAARLIKTSRHLPANYRTVLADIFRQLRANARLAVGVAFDAMMDFVSSWTTLFEVAKHFRGSAKYGRTRTPITVEGGHSHGDCGHLKMAA